MRSHIQRPPPGCGQPGSDGISFITVKRRLTKLLLFLLLGAIVNVAVAWGCARWPRQAMFIVGDKQAPSSQDIAWWNEHVLESFASNVESAYDCSDIGIQTRVLYSATSQQRRVSALHITSGWPARSLAGEAWDVIRLGQRSRWLNREATFVDTNGRYALPLRPTWPGFAINTVFYAAILAILWLLALGPFTLRRAIRRKRGHCIKCGYDLGHADHRACPECGAAA